MATGLKVQGRTQKFKDLINGVYDLQSSQHNGRSSWVKRDVQNVYIFHSGNSRWVISRRLDDGSKCFAYMPENGSKSPLDAKGQWVCADADGEWRSDAKVTTVGAMATDDVFVKMREDLDKELEQYKLNDPNYLKQLWKRMDFNGNQVVSLAEVDKCVIEMVAGGSWPDWLNSKPALMRAFQKTTKLDSAQGSSAEQKYADDYVLKTDFSDLLLNLFWFAKLWQVFEIIDTGHERRIDLAEFTSGLGFLGLKLSPAEAKAEFAKIDGNKGGQVLFVEFCAYVRTRVNPDSNPHFDADIYSGEHCGQTMKAGTRDLATSTQDIHHALRGIKGGGGDDDHKVTATHYISKKSIGCFDELESKIHAIMDDPKQLSDLWLRADFNGNNILSLAEIDKLVVEAYPILNHKPALMRAYKSAIAAGKDDWVHKKLFKTLLGNLFYFNKLFWIFDNVDGDKDRRLTCDEFKWCLNMCGAQMSDKELKTEFKKIDRNGGGIILFDEFCKYFTEKVCPQCMQELVC